MARGQMATPNGNALIPLPPSRYVSTTPTADVEIAETGRTETAQNKFAAGAPERRLGAPRRPGRSTARTETHRVSLRPGVADLLDVLVAKEGKRRSPTETAVVAFGALHTPAFWNSSATLPTSSVPLRFGVRDRRRHIAV